MLSRDFITEYTDVSGHGTDVAVHGTVVSGHDNDVSGQGTANRNLDYSSPAMKTYLLDDCDSKGL